MAIELPTCACGCGAEVLKRSAKGPRPRYATTSCRKRAERQRKATDQFELLPNLAHAIPIGFSAKPVEDQIANAILEARAVGFAFLRLGTQARPELGWRCTKTGEAIVEALGSNFGKDTIE